MSAARPIVVVGAGGFGRETIDVIDAINAAVATPVWNLLGVVDDSPSGANLSRLEQRGTPHLGGVDDLLASKDACQYVIGIGAPTTRRTIARKFDLASWPPATLLHPAASMGFGVTIGNGSVICAGVRLTTNISLGRHVHLNPNVTVGHDTVLGDFVSMNPGSSVSGDCWIGSGVLIGVAGVVSNQVRVGADALVGASACVVRDVLPNVVVKGVPAK